MSGPAGGGGSSRGFAVAALIVVAVILYGSLFPFQWRQHLPPGGALANFLATWRQPPQSRGDLIANILLYLPYGFFATLALGRRPSAALRLGLVTLGAAVLSTGVELTQFFIADRVSCVSDAYLNTAGGLLGGIGGIALGRQFRWPLLGEMGEQPFPALLLIAWLGLRLYPYVPVIDLHKYWRALHPLLFATGGLPTGELLRRTVVWLFLCYLLEIIFGSRRILVSLPLLAALVFGGQIFIVDGVVTLPDVVGAGFAFALWLVALRWISGRTGILVLIFGAVVIALRLQPFTLGPAHGFSFVPFWSFIQGSIEADLQAFLEKFFLYGGLVWLLLQAGMGLRAAAILVATVLLVTSLVEIYLPGRSAELTDALMALLIAWIMSLMGVKRVHSGSPARLYA